MARISKEQRDQKKATLDNYIWELFKEKGWDGVTYQQLADKLGTRKSTIQRYYPSQADFLDGIVGKALPEMMPHLDLSSIDNFIESWTRAAMHPAIKHYSDLIIRDSMQGVDGKLAVVATSNMVRFMCSTFDITKQESEMIYKYLMGNVIFLTMHNTAKHFE